MNSVHPELNGYTANGHTQNGYTNGPTLEMEDITAGETETEAKPEEAEEREKTPKEVQLEQVPRMGQPRDGCRISQSKGFLPLIKGDPSCW